MLKSHIHSPHSHFVINIYPKLSSVILSQRDVILVVLWVTVLILSYQHCTGPVTGTRDCVTARTAIKKFAKMSTVRCQRKLA